MWVRGLKQFWYVFWLLTYLIEYAAGMSHPMWVRGLKPNAKPDGFICFVAPYVGAWIETINRQIAQSTRPSHPMWVRGLKLS